MRRAQGAVDAVEADGRRFLEGMLPDADDFPSLAAKLTGDALVARHVVLSLFIPELPVGFWPRVALEAVVPKTSVDEDGDLLLRDGKVGLSGQSKMPPPDPWYVKCQDVTPTAASQISPLSVNRYFRLLGV